MASPQLEHGYVRIANTILDALCKLRIPGEERQVLDVIIRQTWGYGKKSDMITLDKFAAMTGLKKSNVVRAIKKLVYMNLIIRSDNGKYAFHKDFDHWKPLSKVITPKIVIKSDNPVIKSDNNPLSKVITPYISKEITLKTTIKRQYPPTLKKAFGENLNVYLKEEEYLKAEKKWGKSILLEGIEILSAYKLAKGRKYASDYGALNMWALGEACKRRGVKPPSVVKTWGEMTQQEQDEYMRKKQESKR